ncbi:MAG: hypothetical protein R6W93_08460 [Candidatus Limnocylindrales bacterium]
MRKRSRSWTSLVTVAALGVAGLASALPTGAQPAEAGGQPRVTAAAPTAAEVSTTLVGDLEARGFQVSPGYPMLWGQGACQTNLFPALQSCLGNNPVSPYVIPVFKAWPDEYVGPTPPNAFGDVLPGYTPVYRLAPRDAMVFFGKMPPAGKFMGLQAFVWSQPGRWKKKDYDRWAATADRPYPMEYLFQTIPPDDPKADRTVSWSSFGDSVNNAVMQNQSGEPWGEDRYVITTPSAATAQAVSGALVARGVPAEDIFIEQVPGRDSLGPIGPLGMGKDAVDFYSFFRYALPTDPIAAKQWWTDLPLTVMRVRPPSSLGPVQRYGMATYGERTARSEAYLADDLANLVDGVCDSVGLAGLHSADCAQPAPASSVMPDPKSDYGWNAAYCRQVHMWCGDISDAGLLWSGPLPLDSGQTYAVVGTLATETGNATYVGLGVNDASTFLSPTGVTDSQLKGSALGYGSAVNHAEKFFVHYYSRTCTDLANVPGYPDSCTPLTPEMVPRTGTPDAMGHPALLGMFWPGLRDYMLPDSEHGPDTSKLLRPRILTFTQP